MNPLIYGKNALEHIVSIEVEDDQAVIFTEKDGKVSQQTVPNLYWTLCNEPVGSEWIRLKGDLHYKWAKQYKTRRAFLKDRSTLRHSYDLFSVYNPQEAFMIKYGYTYYKGLNIQDVSTLSFDIETNGLVKDENSRVFLISNTFRKNGQTIQKLFTYDQYENDGAMIEDWCAWVRQEINPSIITGFNILAYDLPWLDHVAKLHNKEMLLGRNASPMVIEDYVSRFRKDQTQDIEYNKIRIYGREIIDGFFLAVKSDIKKEFETYQLKYIVKKKGLEKPGRTFYDASQIRFKYNDPIEWEKIKAYCCFAPNSSLITLNDGSVKLIENLNIGDAVIDRYGNVQYVYDKIKREYNGDIFDVTLDNGRKIFNVTPDHPFLCLNQKTLKQEWKEIKNIKIGDLIFKGEKQKKNKGLHYSDDIIWLFGLFQADGYIRIQKTTRYPVFTQHVNEVHILENCLKKLKYKYSVIQQKNNKSVQIVVSNSKLGELFLKWSGGKFKAWDKKISEEFFNILNNNNRLALNFIAGLFDGDGHVRKKNAWKKTFQAVLNITSPHLINIVDLLCNTIGLNVSRTNFRRIYKYKTSGKIISKHETYKITMFKNSFGVLNDYLRTKKIDNFTFTSETFNRFGKVVKIEKKHYNGLVYNVSITGTNSYISNGLISHNCDDGDDGLAVYDAFIPPFFYFARSVGKTFQALIESATGSQLNSIMLRSYLQNGHSIPKATQVQEFQGALSWGNPGVWNNCFKVDVASLYPSIILTYEIYDKQKDPNGHFLQMVDFFTKERLKNKKLFQETGNQLYEHIEQSQKVGINSAYGLLGVTGLSFNSPLLASKVTEHGREILKKAIEWSTGRKYEEWVPVEVEESDEDDE